MVPILVWRVDHESKCHYIWLVILYVLIDFCVCYCRRNATGAPKVFSEGNETHGFEARLLDSLREDPREKDQRLEQDRLDREQARELKKQRVDFETDTLVAHAKHTLMMENMLAMLMQQQAKKD